MPKMFFGLLVALTAALAAAKPAVSAPSIAQCVKPLEENGYHIQAMEQVGHFYEFEAEKNGQTWQVKTNTDCTITGSKSI